MYFCLKLKYLLLAVSTRPPAGKKTIALSRRLNASVRSFISIHQVATATALLLLCAWFMVIRQVALA